MPLLYMAGVMCVLFFGYNFLLPRIFFNYVGQTIISYDSICSPLLVSQIEAVVQQSTCMSARAIAQKIAEISPMIATCQIKRNVQGVLYVDIQGEDPIISINNRQLITKNNRLVPQEHVVAGIVGKVPHIVVNASIDVEQHKKTIVATVEHTKKYLDLGYQLHINHLHHALLKNSTDRFAIRLSSDALPADARMEKAGVVAQDFKARQGRRLLHSQMVVADLRFKDQLVMYKELKEERS